MTSSDHCTVRELGAWAPRRRRMACGGEVEVVVIVWVVDMVPVLGSR